MTLLTKQIFRCGISQLNGVKTTATRPNQIINTLSIQQVSDLKNHLTCRKSRYEFCIMFSNPNCFQREVGLLKANSHIVCRAHAVPLPCRAVPLKV